MNRELTLISWNVQGRQYRGLKTEVGKILPALRTGETEIFCLQEMCEAKKRLPADLFDKYGAFIPHRNGLKDDASSGFNDNVILSAYPILTAGELGLPDEKGEKVIYENVTKAELDIHGRKLTIYNCHFPIDGAGIATRLRCLRTVLADAARQTNPAVVCGDMNTTILPVGLRRKIIQWWHREPDTEMVADKKFVTGDERYIFHAVAGSYGFREVFDLRQSTTSPFNLPAWETFQLKLDWFLVKNSTPVSFSMGKYISDHRALEVRLRL